MNHERTPAYGIISQNGGLFTVVYFRRPYKCETTGYTVEMFAEYPELPILDYRQFSGNIMGEMFDMPTCDETERVNMYDSRPRVSLSEYLKQWERIGVPVVNFNSLTN